MHIVNGGILVASKIVGLRISRDPQTFHQQLLCRALATPTFTLYDLMRFMKDEYLASREWGLQAPRATLR